MNFKQFFNLLRQQRLFSGIYVTCTALSTALTLTLFLIIYIMVGPVYPEQERGRMAVVQRVKYETKDGGYSMSAASLALADSLRRMPEVECLTAIQSTFMQTVYDAHGEPFTCLPQQVDDAYWRVFDFRFVSGRAFTREEMTANSPVCVISEGLARKAFGRADVAGSTLHLETIESPYYRYSPDSLLQIVGVVEDVSIATPMTCAQLWIPCAEEIFYSSERPLMGGATLAMLLREGATIDGLNERVARFEERINQEMTAAGDTHSFSIVGGIHPHWQHSFSDIDEGDWHPILRKILGLLLAFLLIPAMNMSSMVASRINARISELGIRRAYGASRATLLWQVLQENFLLTLAGSLLGLALSWLIMALGAEWLPFVFQNRGQYMAALVDMSVQIHADMLFSGWVLVAVLVATLVLNLISALVPTMWILHKQVTEEINQKR